MKIKEQNLPMEQTPPRGYEEADIHFGRIMMIGLTLLILMLLGLLYSGVVERVFRETSPHPGAATQVLIESGTGKLPPEPRIEASPSSSLAALRRREDSVLTGYRWVSKDSGLVQVPIARAMELVIAKELLKSREADGPDSTDNENQNR